MAPLAVKVPKAYLRLKIRDSGTPTVHFVISLVIRSAGRSALHLWPFRSWCSKVRSGRDSGASTKDSGGKVTSYRGMRVDDWRGTSKLGTGQTLDICAAKYSRHCNRNEWGGDSGILTVDWAAEMPSCCRTTRVDDWSDTSRGCAGQTLMQPVVEEGYAVVTNQVFKLSRISKN